MQHCTRQYLHTDGHPYRHHSNPCDTCTLPRRCYWHIPRAHPHRMWGLAQSMGHQLSKYFTYVATYLEPPHHCKKAKIVKHSEINKNSFIRFLPFYRPQRSCEGYAFTPVLSVILFTGGGLPQCMLGYHTPPEQAPPNPGPDPPPGPGTPPGPGSPQDHAPPTWDQAPSSPPRTRHPHGTRHPPPPRRRLLLRTVRILLECILVHPAV